MNWTEHYAKWAVAYAVASTQPLDEASGQVLKHLALEARKVLEQSDYEDLEWIISALESPGNAQWGERHCIRYALRQVTQMPERLCRPMLQAAVYEKDPSFNRLYIEPCLRCFGVRRVNEELLDYFLYGSDEEKAGAASAFYWSFGLNGYHDIPEEDVTDLRERVRHLKLQEFVSNDDLNLRRRIIPGLDLKPALYPAHLQPLIPQAIQIARDHPDDYIRHRVEIQLGAGGLYKALPHV